jgi:hypothetical protein
MRRHRQARFLDSTFGFCKPASEGLCWFMSSPPPDSTAWLEWRSLTAAVRVAGAEVMKARRLLNGAVNVQRAARSFNTWTAILDSRIARLKTIEYRYGGRRPPAPVTMLVDVQQTCTEPGCLLRVSASTVKWSGRCPHGRAPIGPACAIKDQPRAVAVFACAASGRSGEPDTRVQL